MEPPLSLVVLRENIHKNAAHLEPQIAPVLRYAEVKNAKSLILQIQAVKAAIPDFSLKKLSLLFGHSITWVRDRLNYTEDSKEAEKDGIIFSKGLKAHPASLLTIEDVQALFTFIAERQSHFDCPSPAEVVAFAESLIFERTGEVRAISDGWWKYFKRKHENLLATKTVSALEEDRAKVQPNEVFAFFEQLEIALQDIYSDEQIISMDEQGVFSRINKGKSKKVVYLLDRSEEPSVCEFQDACDVSVVATINYMQSVGRAFLLLKQEPNMNDPALVLRRKLFDYAVTSKGYQTNETTLEWVEKTLIPYFEQSTVTKQKCILLIDGFGPHFCPAVKDKLSKIGNVTVICYPPHSSHFLQVLDQYPIRKFRELYLKSSRSQIQFGDSKVTQKICRIIDAYQSSMTCNTIVSSWDKVCVQVLCNGSKPRFTIKWNRVKYLIEKYCPNGFEYCNSNPKLRDLEPEKLHQKPSIKEPKAHREARMDSNIGVSAPRIIVPPRPELFDS